MRAPKESATSEVLNIVGGPGIQVTADVLCSENGNSIACSRQLDALDLGLGVQSEAVSSVIKGNTKEMKAGGKVYCPFFLVIENCSPFSENINDFLMCPKTSA